MILWRGRFHCGQNCQPSYLSLILWPLYHDHAVTLLTSRSTVFRTITTIFMCTITLDGTEYCWTLGDWCDRPYDYYSKILFIWITIAFFVLWIWTECIMHSNHFLNERYIALHIISSWLHLQYTFIVTIFYYSNHMDGQINEPQLSTVFRTVKRNFIYTYCRLVDTMTVYIFICMNLWNIPFWFITSFMIINSSFSTLLPVHSFSFLSWWFNL